mmetsp:Transcript_49531/g.94639  ORF Transcript_49531/g.94639 Transcript_49531/m.94639 type:complete len:203 (+) Transcript_49531:118-726(+)
MGESNPENVEEIFVPEGGETARPADVGPAIDKKAQSPLAINFLEPTEKTVAVLKKLNAHIFPVSYQEKFYADCLACMPYTCMALYSDFVIGAICCRFEKVPDPTKLRLYIMTLGVFAPYRRRGVGAKLLAHTMNLAKEDPKVDEVYLHVQVNNYEAMEFYKAFGFELKETIKNYYRKIDPPDCHVYTRSVHDWVAPEGTVQD